MSEPTIKNDADHFAVGCLLLLVAALFALTFGATAWRLCWLGPDWLVAVAPLVALVAAILSGRLLSWLAPGLRKLGREYEAYRKKGA